MKLLSCSLYNSWDTLKNDGSAGLVDRTLNPSGSISKLAAGHYDLDVLAKKNNKSVLKFKIQWVTLLPQSRVCRLEYAPGKHYTYSKIYFQFREVVTTTLLEHDPPNHKIDGDPCMTPCPLPSTSKDRVFLHSHPSIHPYK